MTASRGAQDKNSVVRAAPTVITIEIKAPKLLAAGAEGITLNVTPNQDAPPPEPLPPTPAEPA